MPIAAGFKRLSKEEILSKKKKLKQNCRANDEKFTPSSSQIDESGDLSEEHTDIAFEEEEAENIIYREQSTYDKLLKTFGSGSEAVANAFRRRQIEEEGRSNTDEHEDGDIESSRECDEQLDGSGNDEESPRSNTFVRVLKGFEMVDGMELSEDVGTDDDGLSGTDEDNDVRVNGQSISEASVITSTFANHLDYKLSKKEIDHLLRRKWSYSWKMPAFNISKGYWRGTGVCPVEDIVDDGLPDINHHQQCQWLSLFSSYLHVLRQLDSIHGSWMAKMIVSKMEVKKIGNCVQRIGTWIHIMASSHNVNPKDWDMDSHYGLKPRLSKHWLETYDASKGSEFHKSKQRLFFSICNSYQDILHHNKKPFYLKGQEEDSSIMDSYLVHSLNHIFKSKDLMTKNERKLAKNQEIVEDEILKGSSYLDRGFTRPKVLILLPLAGIARLIINRLIQLTPSKNKAYVENIGRFNEEYGFGSTEDQDEEDDSEKSKSRKSAKPSNFQALLGRDNNNDHFMIGIKFTKKSMRLYSDFYSSDMIIASAIGLFTKIREAEVDYLSSIEILIIDHADVMVMQNWTHVKTVVEHLNQIPSKQHGTDIMRIRPWYLDGQARFYRQTIILGSLVNPDINTLFNQLCFNYQGKVKLECSYKGVLPKVLVQVRQIYEHIETKSIVEADDNRLEYFAKKVFPKIKDSVQPGIMIFISSYLEFVRLRNFLKSQGASFCLFGEYIKQKDISSIRGQFFRGEKKIMLYTERAHFYYRYKIRGVQNLIIYSLPERKEFYPEIVNLLESDNMNCNVLFSRLDFFRLERIVGSAAAKRMVNSEKGIFVFA